MAETAPSGGRNLGRGRAMKKLVVSVVAMAVMGATSALAADMPVKAKPVVEVSPWDFAFGAAIMTDYNFRGVTQSAHKPSASVYFEPRYNIDKDTQLYAGIAGE